MTSSELSTSDPSSTETAADSSLGSGLQETVFEADWWKEMEVLERELLAGEHLNAEDSERKSPHLSDSALWKNLQQRESEYLEKKRMEQAMRKKEEQKRKDRAAKEKAKKVQKSSQLAGFFSSSGGGSSKKSKKKKKSSATMKTSTVINEDDDAKSDELPGEIPALVPGGPSVSRDGSSTQSARVSSHHSPSSVAAAAAAPSASDSAKSRPSSEESTTVSDHTSHPPPESSAATIGPIVGSVIERREPIHGKSVDSSALHSTVESDPLKPPPRMSRFKLKRKLAAASASSASLGSDVSSSAVTAAALSPQTKPPKRVTFADPVSEIEPAGLVSSAVSSSSKTDSTAAVSQSPPSPILRRDDSVNAVGSIPSVRPRIRVLFLDVDGVLNCRSTFSIGVRDQISKEHVMRLKRVVAETQCRIVLSTSWRLIHTAKSVLLETLKSQVSDALLPPLKHDDDDSTSAESELPLVIGETPDMKFSGRPREIETWLRSHSVHARFDIAQWVAVDDMPLDSMSESSAQFMRGHFVKTSFEFGLTDRLTDRLISMLNGEWLNSDSVFTTHSSGMVATHSQPLVTAAKKRLLFVNVSCFLKSSTDSSIESAHFRKRSTIFDGLLSLNQCAKISGLVRACHCRIVLLVDWGVLLDRLFDEFKMAISEQWKMSPELIDAIFVDPIDRQSSSNIHNNNHNNSNQALLSSNLLCISEYIRTKKHQSAEFSDGVRWCVLDQSKDGYPCAELLSGLVFSELNDSNLRSMYSFFNSD